MLYGVHAEPTTTQPAPGAPRAGQNAKLNAPFTRFDVDFVIREQDVVLRPEAQGVRSGKILMGLKAYDRDGNAVNWEGVTETLRINPDQYSSLQKTGIPVHLEFDLPSSVYVHLVTAVYDWNSGKAGNLEIPVTLPRARRRQVPGVPRTTYRNNKCPQSDFLYPVSKF